MAKKGAENTWDRKVLSDKFSWGPMEEAWSFSWGTCLSIKLNCSYLLFSWSSEFWTIIAIQERDGGFLERSTYSPSITYLHQLPYVFVDDGGVWLWYHPWSPLQGHHRLVGRCGGRRLLKEHMHTSFTISWTLIHQERKCNIWIAVKT